MVISDVSLLEFIIGVGIAGGAAIVMLLIYHFIWILWFERQDKND